MYSFDPFSRNRSLSYWMLVFVLSLHIVIIELELGYLGPEALSFGRVVAVGFSAGMMMLGVLTVVYNFDWTKGALR